MSFLAGGSECAANANPLAQLSKRSDFDTSLQNNLRNGSQLHGENRAAGGLRQEAVMNGRDQDMYHALMDQQNPLIHTHGQPNAFNFQPLSHELNNVALINTSQQNRQQQRLPQPQTHIQQQNWSAEFMGSSMSSQAAPVANMVQNGEARANFSAPYQIGQRNPMLMGGMAASGIHMMQTPQMRGMASRDASMQSTSVQTDVHASLDKAEWEDSFKEIEQQVGKDGEITAVDDGIHVQEMQSAFDDARFDTPMGFNEKYHEDYQFEEKNEFINNPNAYEIGCKLMEGGAKLSEAALAFEAAVQEDPKHTDAWLKLGQVQIQNEKELHGITALENCLLIDPKNLTALMSLAISYVNEGYDNAAFKTFENWIESKYPDVVSKARNENPDDTSDDRYSLNKRITNLFLRAAQLSPTGANVDADVQTGLGVLFYSMEEYDKTLDCFQAAIRCNPNDALSWNRLGASYANSNRPEQAIEAYSKALQLNPNFVRARYNLGVSFINMGMYKDAVEHLLTGLSMHEVESPDGEGMLVSDTEQSSNLIETLKRAFLAMDRRDLIDKVRPGMNVARFRNEFHV